MDKKNEKNNVTLTAKQYILLDDNEKIVKALKDRTAKGSEILKEFRSRYEKYPSNYLIETYIGKYKTWNDHNETMLETEFTAKQIVNNYESITAGVYSGQSVPERAKRFDWLIAEKIRYLESLIGRMPFFDKATELVIDKSANAINYGSKVFIVHGHNEVTKLLVARLLEKLDIKPIILHEVEDKGRTVIEKLEQESKDAGFAVVLLTADDIGKSVKENDTKRRARQNVILELGYFIARLGRPKVCALYEEGVDLPSDFDGVLYTPLDDAGAWKTKLAKEIKASEFDIDLNKL